MTNFSEANLNVYLNSISNNLTELQSFANDIEANFVNCFQTRFNMTTQDIADLNSWPQVLKDELTLFTRMTVDYFTTNQSINLDFEIVGFEDPSSEESSSLEALPDKVKVKVEGYLDYTQSTGTIKYKAKAKVEAQWYIC